MAGHARIRTIQLVLDRRRQIDAAANAQRGGRGEQEPHVQPPVPGVPVSVSVLVSGSSSLWHQSMRQPPAATVSTTSAMVHPGFF
jgi:hypothetical protein